MKHTKFNPENKEKLTFGESLGPAMEITDQEDADQYFQAMLEWHMKESLKSQLELAQICKQNLGYYAGYYSTETRVRVEKLFVCAHPIFGEAKKSIPTNEEAYQMGVELGKKLKSK